VRERERLCLLLMAFWGLGFVVVVSDVEMIEEGWTRFVYFGTSARLTLFALSLAPFLVPLLFSLIDAFSASEFCPKLSPFLFSRKSDAEMSSGSEL
jgi:hypothetical protein